MLEHVLDDRISSKATKTLEELLEKIKSYHPAADLAVVEKAYYFSEKAHEGQIRRSGEPYISHPLSVAGILADLHLDLDSIITGLLHDTVEDTPVTLDEIKREFGETVAHLVDGVTKLGQMKFRNAFEKQGENIRKMIVAMGKDVRVVLVKLGDRLHNMRTLNHMPYEKQSRIAQETLEIYCPLAGRMGISSMKIELEDLCFRYYRPDMYYQLTQKIKKTEQDQGRYIEEVKKLIGESLEKTGIKFEVQGRSKHLWSIYRKMASRNIEYEQVYDVLAFRVVVGTVPECYEVLGYVHSIWKPIPGRFKDFIAMPKTNNYRSLHTTVVGPGGERIEIQIRTDEMQQIAERGIAAHWKYKERGKFQEGSLEQANWLKDLVAIHQQTKSSDEFLDSVKTDLFESEIYVFTPNGDVREFPEGATPVDFAYSIHSDLGNKCVGARVNGRMVPIKYKLQNGDTIEVISSKSQTPSKDWLKFVVTNKAKSKIRLFVKEEQRKRSLLLGKDLVEREFRKFGQSASRQMKGDEFEKFLIDFGLKDTDDLFVRVGYGKLEPRHLVERLTPAETTTSGKQEQVNEQESFMEKVRKSAVKKTKRSNSLVSVDGMDDVLVHFARCCSPIPGDPIVGFISRGRGISIHRADCSKSFEFDAIRRVDVAWNRESGSLEQRVVTVQVIAQDIPGLLKLMSEAFAVQEINIESAQIHTTRDKKANCLFDISVRDAAQLSQAIYSLQKLKGVITVQRVSHG